MHFKCTSGRCHFSINLTELSKRLTVITSLCVGLHTHYYQIGIIVLCNVFFMNRSFCVDGGNWFAISGRYHLQEYNVVKVSSGGSYDALALPLG